ncbi:hypothetical protein ROG8370_03949 [Roseovarius gaetbuli]|uniref:AAA+ ATPase domain-containing protein n=1 Tax=Roseovarius gaetbuli TaxID=1356575 RepID=A0A1X7ADE7_9RHOB|nr:hypothetical protein [Roseovarius gaetbuli]SLN77206.1 hypothetical protein ROG8370_03949 [Roseovarius gaetbuli]
MNYNWQIPPLGGNGHQTEIELADGVAVFVVGANGSGKSALITQLSKATTALKVIRIAAHRQSWLHSSSVDLTPKSRRDLQRNISSRDRQDDSRWKDDYAQPRTQAALFDLANARNRVSREVLELLKADAVEEATTTAKLPSPLEAMNDILAVSSLSVRLSINDDGDILASHDGAAAFSISIAGIMRPDKLDRRIRIGAAASGEDFIEKRFVGHFRSAKTNSVSADGWRGGAGIGCRSVQFRRLWCHSTLDKVGKAGGCWN